MTIVKLQQSVPCSILEKALFKAAEEIGWKAKIEDNFIEEYQLGSVKENQVYESTKIILKGLISKKMSVSFNKKGPMNYFFIQTGYTHGNASKNEVKEYLSVVSKNL